MSGRTTTARRGSRDSFETDTTHGSPTRVELGRSPGSGDRELILTQGGCALRYGLSLVCKADVVVSIRVMALGEAVQERPLSTSRRRPSFSAKAVHAPSHSAINGRRIQGRPDAGQRYVYPYVDIEPRR
jgi:hypothetical protein